MAEGAKVIVPSGAKAYFEMDIKSPHAVVADELQRRPRTAEVQEVRDQLTLKDEVSEVRLYNIPNPHVQGYLLAHVVTGNIVYVTDLISPRGPIERNENTVPVGDALRKYGITGAMIVGGHGTTAKQADIGPALAAN